MVSLENNNWTKQDFQIVKDLLKKTNNIAKSNSQAGKVSQAFELRYQVLENLSTKIVSLRDKITLIKANLDRFLSDQNNDWIAQCVSSLQSFLPEKSKEVVDEKSNLGKVEAALKETRSYIEGLDGFHEDKDLNCLPRIVLESVEGDCFIISRLPDVNGFTFAFKEEFAVSHVELHMYADGVKIVNRSQGKGQRPGDVQKEVPVSGKDVFDKIKKLAGYHSGMNPVTKQVLAGLNPLRRYKN